jgi:hypothetical protein
MNFKVGRRADKRCASRSASRALILGSARPASTSLLSFSMITAGVLLGTPTPPMRSPRSRTRTHLRSGFRAARRSAPRGYCERPQPVSPDIVDRRDGGGEHDMDVPTGQIGERRPGTTIGHMDRLAPARCAIPTAAQQRPLPNAEISVGEVSFQSLRGMQPMGTGRNRLIRMSRLRKRQCRPLAHGCPSRCVRHVRSWQKRTPPPRPHPAVNPTKLA